MDATLLCVLLCILQNVYSQSFAAVSKHADLHRRAFDFDPRHGIHSLLYGDARGKMAQVQVASKWPTLVLEEVGSYFESVLCTEESMAIFFNNEEAMRKAADTWEVHETFVLITNHHGCNNLGQHSARRSRVTKSDYTTNSITLETEILSLHEASNHLTVEFGEHLAPLGHEEMLQSRQADADSTTKSSSAASTSPDSIPSSNSASGDISFSWVNTTILPPDSAIINALPGASSLENIRFSCENCTTNGNVELTAGGFSMTSMELDGVVDFFDEGYLEFDATNLFANMQFGLEFLPGFSILQFEPALPSIPLTPITVRGVVTLGPVLEFTFPMSIALANPVKFVTGFNLTAPPEAKIYLNVSDPESSYTTGLSDIELHTLPFTADTENLTMTLSAGFKPQLKLTATLGDDLLNAEISGDVSVFLDLPSMVTTLSSLGSGSNCPESKLVQDLAGLTQLSTSAISAVGAGWNLAASISAIEYGKNAEYQLDNVTMDLPIQCLAWDNEGGSLMDALSVAKKIAAADSSGGSGSGGKSKSASGALRCSRRMALVAVSMALLWLA